MADLVLLQAQQLNFPCREDNAGNWQILPLRSQDRWQLKSLEGRWILSIAGVPQISLSPQEAIKFLLNQARSSE
ncbi:MAG: hypothetical protein ACLFV6_07490 [Spirulinaceae cyanobacterium]